MDQLIITITEKIVDRDAETGRLYIDHGYRHIVGQPESKVYLPREHFKDEDPTPASLLHHE